MAKQIKHQTNEKNNSTICPGVIVYNLSLNTEREYPPVVFTVLCSGDREANKKDMKVCVIKG